VRGDPAYNVDLSQRRAQAVKEAMAQHGLDIDVAVQGEGVSTLIPGTTEHDYAYNRRVELTAPKQK
jgi:outer membrane protein OmpA-like peptidoglycan-associated protein